MEHIKELGPWEVEERVPELALSRSQTDDYLEHYHRIFVCRQIKIESESHMGVLD